MRKSGKSTKHRKTREFLATRGGGGWSPAGGGGPSLLRRGEKRRTARTRPGGPWPDFWADAPRRLRRIPRPAISSQCGLESFWMWTCFRNIFLMFFEKRSWNRTGTLLEIDGFFGEQVSSRKLLPRVFPEELLPISTCYFV